MKQLFNKSGLSISAVLIASLYLTACSDSSSFTSVNYEVKVVNATNNQPLSPMAVILHNTSYSAWSIGSAASTELESLAEGGSNTLLLDSVTNIDASTASGSGAIFPGSSVNGTVNISSSSTTQTQITVATMLINTNDAFAGFKSIDVSDLAIGDSLIIGADVHDAGTEKNTESIGTIPGPADGGEGFNAARTDINDVVRAHGGVVTADDGLGSSILNQSHRFDNPGVIVTITRI